MQVAVAIKRVVDYQVQVRLNAQQTAVETDQVKMSLNPFDEIALEAALSLKEQSVVSRVIAVSVGDEACEETLRHALAFGADQAVLVHTHETVQPLAVAAVFAYVAKQYDVKMFWLGKQAIDTDNGQTGAMLAALLGWPQATALSSMAVSDGCALIERETDQGLVSLSVPLPAVLTADLRLNTPRYVSLPGILAARQKPLEKMDYAALPIDPYPQLTTQQLRSADVHRAGVMCDSVEELMRKLKQEGVLP